MQVVIFSSPNRDDMLARVIKEMQGHDIAVIGDKSTFGVGRFWKRWEQARQICLNSPHDNYLILSDDACKHDMQAIASCFDRWEGKPFTCQVISDNREHCWGSSVHEDSCYNDEGYHWINCGFFDCGGLTNRATLQQIEVTKTVKGKRVSSGVGMQLTKKLRALNVPMYKTFPSLSYHGDHPSVMHPQVRKLQPLVTVVKQPKVIVGMATFKGREKALERSIASLEGQVDQIVLYNNSKHSNPDLTDNGKFYHLHKLTEPCYFLTCDDDLIYPHTYVQDMIAAIDKHRCIVTHHGRILVDGAQSYYRGHKSFHCLKKNKYEGAIDVAGTGVSGWHTSYFHPKNLHESSDKRMSDLVFSIEARKQKKRIVVLKHDERYIDAVHLPLDKTIYGMEHKRDHRQTEIANEIFNLRS